MLNGFGKNRALLIACAVILVGIIAVISVSAAVSANPYNQVMNAFEKSAKSALENDAFLQTQKVASGGSITVSGNLGELMEQMTGAALDIGAEAKVYIDAGQTAMAAEAALTMGDEPLLDGSVYFDREKLVLACAALLGDTAYGVDLTKLEKNFADSEFGPDGAYAIGMDEEDIAELFDTLEQEEDMRKDAEKIVQDAVAVLVKSFKKNAEAERTKDSAEFGEETVKTNVVTITLDGRALTAIAKDMVKYLDTDKSVETFISTYAGVLASEIGLDPDDLLDEYKDAIDDAKDMLEDFSDSVEEVEIEIAVSIAKSTKEVVALTVKLEDDKETVAEINLLCGPTWSALTELSLEVEADGSSLKAVYAVEEDSKEEYRTSFKLTADGDELASLKLSHEKKEGDFKLTLTLDGEEFILRGSAEKKGKKTTYILKSFTVDEEKIKLGDIAVVINTADKIPAPGKYTDVMTLDADEIEEILADVEEVFEEIGSDIMMRVLGGLS